MPMCECVSTRPGIIVLPVRSITSAPWGMGVSDSGPTAMILFLRTISVPLSMGAPAAVRMRAPRYTIVGSSAAMARAEARIGARGTDKTRAKTLKGRMDNLREGCDSGYANQDNRSWVKKREGIEGVFILE